MLLLEHAFYKGEQGLIACLADRKRLGDSWHDLLRITHRSERHQENPIGDRLTKLSSNLQAQARFTNPARSGECHQADVLPAQQLLDSCNFLPSPDQWGRLDRQVVWRDIERLVGWEDFRQAYDA